jgi:predicted enzyme related to lactoylglutathione lyase
MTPKEQQRLSTVVWFEIPASDLPRATAFYENILQMKMRPYEGGGEKLSVFPYNESGIGGALIAKDNASTHGSLIYLNADPSLDAILSRVETAGGSVLLGRTDLPPGMGVFARIKDTEGNAVGLHAIS